jgi:hypothetical protein
MPKIQSQFEDQTSWSNSKARMKMLNDVYENFNDRINWIK